MKRIIFFISIFVNLNLYFVFSQENKNIVNGQVKVHDPVMIKEKNVYYIFHTGKGIPIKRSIDKKNWENIGKVYLDSLLPVWHKIYIPDQDDNLWAPDIHYRNGKFHLYYSVSAWMNFNSSIGYATNITLNPESPDYQWIDQGMVISYKNGGEGVNVIDPNVFVDEDGRVWLFYGSFKAGLRLVELDKQTGKLLKDPPEITVITTGMGEGVFVLKSIDNYYYIFASRGICCKGVESNYHIVMGRAKDIKGPYLNRKNESWIDNKFSVLLEGNYEEPGRGHCGFFSENDTTYIVYHSYTRSANGASLLNIKVLYKDKDNWPTLENTGQLFKIKPLTNHFIAP